MICLIILAYCGISLKKEMPPDSHVQQLNNCKQPDLELLALSFQTVYVCKIPPVGRGGSLAGQRTNKRLLTYLYYF